jgi:lipoprotein-anchoring transpeptidase ErfK/SrfK
MTILALFLLAVAGLYLGADRLLSRWRAPGAAAGTGTDQGGGAAPVAGDGALPFTPERYLTLSATDRIAVGPADGPSRQVALLKAGKLVGQPVKLADFPLTLQDLPRAQGVLVLAGSLPKRGEPKPVILDGTMSLEAAGGEPDMRAWQPDGARGLVPVDYYQLAAPVEPPEPDAVVVDKWLNVLWAYQGGQLVQTARVATGRYLQGPAPSAANQAQNYLTPVGRWVISNKQPGMTYWKENIPKGDPRNPLGTRWLGFSVFAGDKAGIWAIHGTNEPDSMGQWVSDGCIRMRNPEVETLYERVKDGTPLIIISSQP